VSITAAELQPPHFVERRVRRRAPHGSDPRDRLTRRRLSDDIQGVKTKRPAFEVVPRTVWFHGGWGVALDPSFEHLPVDAPNTLCLGDKSDRTVSLSAYRIQRTDGQPWKTDDMLADFPPPEFSGRHYQHRTEQVSSRALWMFGDSDHLPSCWLLVALVMSESTLGKGVHCTITTPQESDLAWALETWRGILDVPDREEDAKKVLIR